MNSDPREFVDDALGLSGEVVLDEGAQRHLFVSHSFDGEQPSHDVLLRETRAGGARLADVGEQTADADNHLICCVEGVGPLLAEREYFVRDVDGADAVVER